MEKDILLCAYEYQIYSIACYDELAKLQKKTRCICYTISEMWRLLREYGGSGNYVKVAETVVYKDGNVEAHQLPDIIVGKLITVEPFDRPPEKYVILSRENDRFGDVVVSLRCEGRHWMAIPLPDGAVVINNEVVRFFTEYGFRPSYPLGNTFITKASNLNLVTMLQPWVSKSKLSFFRETESPVAGCLRELQKLRKYLGEIAEKRSLEYIEEGISYENTVFPDCALNCYGPFDVYCDGVHTAEKTKNYTCTFGTPLREVNHFGFGYKENSLISWVRLFDIDPFIYPYATEYTDKELLRLFPENYEEKVEIRAHKRQRSYLIVDVLPVSVFDALCRHFLE